MAGGEKRGIWSDPNRLWTLGIALYCFSFIVPVVPPIEKPFRVFGFSIFLMVPALMFQILSSNHALPPTKMLWMTLEILGWLANFTVILPLRSTTARLAIFLPWCSMIGAIFVGLLDETPHQSFDWDWLAAIPFYPWAIGIGLVQ